MTTSRVIRGTRAKIFLYICALLIIVGIIACYNNTLSQLDDVKKSNDICHQQEENLSTQLQVISEYKQRLEKSLKTEKADHQQALSNLEDQLKEERNKNEKYSSESKMKFSSLQQHFNLLQTEYDDFKEETSKAQKQQQEEINTLQAKLKEVQEELKKVKASKESLKSEYMELLTEKEHFEKEAQRNQNDNNDFESNINHLTLENDELKREIKQLKESCSRNQDTLAEPRVFSGISSPKSTDKAAQLNPPDNSAANVLQSEEKQENNVLALPDGDNKDKMASSSSSTKAGLKPSQASLSGARPILSPTVTPETLAKKGVLMVPEKKKLPDGVVAVPERKEHNDQPEIINARYQNARESAKEHADEKAVREEENENGAHEVFDSRDDHVKHAEKQHFDKQHIDTLGNERDQDQPDYKDLQNDVQLEENEEDDDGDGYDDHIARQKDPAVRN
ncbi:uncharacterized protein isoform X2 [Leptinotarsa decemlineata]|uniref:uncharacterized protein isoform X2 n=1 Tax=Leptinotarsa decemlineata TaxID=7539 RepID=UPI000C2551FD|nr:glutamic acid-rich protein-like isoform X2 [Leptinotarsa decemlineata]